MPHVRNCAFRIGLISAALVGGLSLSGCATQEYVDEQIATVNTRIGAVDAKASDAISRADAANAAAQAAAADARTANDGLAQLSGRVGILEQSQVRTPRN